MGVKLFVCFLALSCILVEGKRVPGVQFREYESFMQPKDGSLWAVLVAGSNSWFNYRHQADVCHAYQTLVSHGVDPSKIIVMMYDDIANATDNPTQGQIVNIPGGPDVYKGVSKDYTGDEVTPDNFIGVLTGDKELQSRGKKVLNTTQNDRIFVYFSDHGAPGIVSFPEEYLNATKLNKALKKMHTNKLYSQMVIYIEACESGSMFDKLLPKNINIFATTAANSIESSYACYWDEARQTYLGDVYSVNWLQDSDAHKDLSAEKLQNQFEIVRKETNESHVEEFGDKRIANEPLSLFQGSKKAQLEGKKISPITDAVPSNDVPLVILKKHEEHVRNGGNQQSYYRNYTYKGLLRARKMIDTIMKRVFKQVANKHIDIAHEILFNNKRRISDQLCYEQLVETVHRYCYKLTTHNYMLRHLYVLVNICESRGEQGNGGKLKAINEELKQACIAHTDGVRDFEVEKVI